MKEKKKPEHLTRWVTGVRAGKLQHVLAEVLNALDEGKTVKVVCQDHQIQALETLGIPAECITTVSEVYHEKTKRNLDIYLQMPDSRMRSKPYYSVIASDGSIDNHFRMEYNPIYLKKGGDDKDEEDPKRRD